VVATFPIIAMGVIALASWVIVRTGATALRLTGVSADAAGFQAVSGFFGVGFTTSEAEIIVNHPIRRRIMTHLIIAGNLGITSGLATVVVAFVEAGQNEDQHRTLTLGVLAAIIATIVLAARANLLNRVIDAVCRFTLQRAGMVAVVDYASVLGADHGFVVHEFKITETHPLANQTLRQAGLRERGVLVLGIFRPREGYHGTPTPETEIGPGDVLTVYGRHETLADQLGG